MHRIDSPNVYPDKFGPGKDGWREGDVATGTPATETTEDWFDAVQEELANIVEGFDGTLSKTNHEQVFSLVETLFANIAVANLTERTNGKNFKLYSVCYSEDLELFVAVGEADGTDAYIVTSPDGITWTERSNPKNFDLYSVCWGGSLFVAVGEADGTDAYIVTSPDGITWTERSNTSNESLFGVCYGNSTFVAVGDATFASNVYVLTSSNGTTWNIESLSFNQRLNAVCWANNQFVAVGDQIAGTGLTRIATSPDGSAWTERANTGNTPYNSVVYARDKYVAAGLGDGGVYLAIATSADGITWASIANPHSDTINALVYVPGLFVGVGGHLDNHPYLATSPDGVNWTERTFGLLKSFALRGACYGRGQFVAVGAADGSDSYIVTSIRIR